MSLYVYMALALPVGLILGGVFLAMPGARRRSRVARMSCGACHYPVEGLPTFICPECGSDLREAGILTPGRLSRQKQTTIVLLLWTLAAGLMAFAFVVRVMAYVPFRVDYVEHHPYVARLPDRTYMYKAKLNVFSDHSEFGDTLTGTLRLVLSGPESSETETVLDMGEYGDLAVSGKPAVMTIDLRTQEWSRDWGDGSSKGKVADLDVAFMERWIETVEAELEGDDRHGAAQILRYIVREHSAGREPDLNGEMYWYRATGGSWSRSTDRSARMAVGIGVGFVWFVIWGAGVGWIQFRGSRSRGGRGARVAS